MKSIFFIVSFLFSFALNALEPQPIDLDCKDAKKEAVTEIPEPFEDLAAVHCTIYGHLITGSEGVLWNYPGGFAPVIIPSQMVKAEPKVVNHEMYFTSITANTLKGKEAKNIFSRFGKGFDMSEVESPAEVLELVATNNESIEQKVYLFNAGQNSIWGFACQPTCKPEMSFMVLKMRKQ